MTSHAIIKEGEKHQALMLIGGGWSMHINYDRGWAELMKTKRIGEKITRVITEPIPLGVARDIASSPYVRRTQKIAGVSIFRKKTPTPEAGQ